MAIGLLLGPVLAGISMIELEGILLSTLREHISPWKRYVDDTISYIKEESIEHVLSKLNGYHDNIEFTKKMMVSYEVETAVYRKSTNNDIYLHWQSLSPKT